MSSIELATDIVRVALERPEGPTEEQVEHICHLSRYELLQIIFRQFLFAKLHV